MKVEIALLTRMTQKTATCSAASMYDWLIENTPSYISMIYIDYIDEQYLYEIEFDDEADAMACKLRWYK